jgi:hypothetical protein
MCIYVYTEEPHEFLQCLERTILWSLAKIQKFHTDEYAVQYIHTYVCNNRIGYGDYDNILKINF